MFAFGLFHRCFFYDFSWGKAFFESQGSHFCVCGTVLFLLRKKNIFENFHRIVSFFTKDSISIFFHVSSCGSAFQELKGFKFFAIFSKNCFQLAKAFSELKRLPLGIFVKICEILETGHFDDLRRSRLVNCFHTARSEPSSSTKGQFFS